MFDVDERRRTIEDAPAADRFLRRFVGADELLNGKERFALWITESERMDALQIPAIAARIDQVAVYRSGSRREATRKLAGVPHRFGEVRHRESAAIVVPRHSSENRSYVPMGFVDKHTVVGDACCVIYDAEPWLFSVLMSRMHNVWVRAVGGRIKTDFRYSATLCYNTFPVPPISDTASALLTDRAFAVLEAREHHSDRTLAQLYDPVKMPAELREAHQFLDAAVDQLYRKRPFQSDDERLELLFDLYEASVGGEVHREEELELATDA